MNTTTPVPSDPFANLESLRLSQDFGAVAAVKKLLVTVPVRRPNSQTFVRVHPDPEYRLTTPVLELKDERETYIVAQALWPQLAQELIPKQLVTSIDRSGNIFIWPIRMPGSDGKIDDWNRAAAEAANIAINTWIRLKANQSLGSYDIYEAPADIPDPTWPEMSFPDLLRVAFKGRIIDTMTHPVVTRLVQGK